MKKIFTMSLFFLLFGLSFTNYISAQEEEKESLISLNTGADLVSSYNWRAIDVGNSPAIQPYMSLAIQNFEVYAWGSYAFIANESVMEDDSTYRTVPYNEIDLALKYNIETSAGTFSPEVTDYFFPYKQGRFSDFQGDGKGQHTVSLALRYTGTETFPVQFLIDYYVHNDIDKPVYFEASYPFQIGESELSVVAGFAKGKDKSDSYGLENGNLCFVNAGVKFSRTIKITNDFELPLSSSFIVNPYASKAYLTFMVSL